MNEIPEKFLPIGSVVLMNGGVKKVMVTGYAVKSPESGDKLWDYIGCIFPEGMLAPDKNLLFDHKDIAEVFDLGYVNDEQKEFMAKLNKIIAEIPSVPNDDTSNAVMPAPSAPASEEMPAPVEDSTMPAPSVPVVEENTSVEMPVLSDAANENVVNVSETPDAPVIENAPAEVSTEPVVEAPAESAETTPVEMPTLSEAPAEEIPVETPAEMPAPVENASPEMPVITEAPVSDATVDVPAETPVESTETTPVEMPTLSEAPAEEIPVEAPVETESSEMPAINETPEAPIAPEMPVAEPEAPAEMPTVNLDVPVTSEDTSVSAEVVTDDNNNTDEPVDELSLSISALLNTTIIPPSEPVESADTQETAEIPVENTDDFASDITSSPFGDTTVVKEDVPADAPVPEVSVAEPTAPVMAAAPVEPVAPTAPVAPVEVAPVQSAPVLKPVPSLENFQTAAPAPVSPQMTAELPQQAVVSSISEITAAPVDTNGTNPVA